MQIQLINCEKITDFLPLIFFSFFPSLSGLSPFLGDNDTETMNNILHSKWEFDAEAFEHVSEEAKDFISSLLVPAKWYSSIIIPLTENLRIYRKSSFLSHIIRYPLFYYFSSFLVSSGFKSLTFLFHLSVIILCKFP